MTGAKVRSGRAPWRLLIDPPADGAWNMAVDEALLSAYDTGLEDRAPTLRLYGWSPATLSLGRSQAAGDAHDPGFLAREGIELVRRPTGGEAVLHEHERTYAVVGRLRSDEFPGGVVETYRQVAAAVRAGLARLGIAAAAPPALPRAGRGREPVCFESAGAHELAVEGRKLVGSAQARRRRAFLQHGSIPIRLEAGRLGAAIGVPARAERFTDLTRAAGAPLAAGALDEALVRGFEEAFGIEFRRGALDPDEALRAAELRCWKYDSMAWTFDARIGDRERRWGPDLSPAGASP